MFFWKAKKIIQLKKQKFSYSLGQQTVSDIQLCFYRKYAKNVIHKLMETTSHCTEGTKLIKCAVRIVHSVPRISGSILALVVVSRRQCSLVYDV